VEDDQPDGDPDSEEQDGAPKGHAEGLAQPQQTVAKSVNSTLEMSRVTPHAISASRLRAFA